jgi:hypothetical protein
MVMMLTISGVAIRSQMGTADQHRQALWLECGGRPARVLALASSTRLIV